MNTSDSISGCMAALDVDHRYPLMVILDITNACNFECPHCPQPMMAAKPGYKPRFFDFDAFARLVSEIKNAGVKFIRFTGDGEPMLHKRFMDMVKLAKQESTIPLVLTTNGSLLNEDRIISLLEIGIDVIDVSLDAFTRSKYEVVRKGGKYHQTMANLHQLLYQRQKRKSSTRVMVNMINQDLVAGEVEKFREYWTPLVDFVLVRNLHTATKQVNQAEVADKLAQKHPDRHPCAHLWKRMTIDYALNAKFCAHDWFDEAVLSRLGEGGLGQIWFSDRLKEIRHAHIINDYINVPLCADCPDWAAAPWDYGYEKIMEKIGVIQLPEIPSFAA